MSTSHGQRQDAAHMHRKPIVTITLILCCALVGGYAGIFTSFRHGFFDALRRCVSLPPSAADWREVCILTISHAASIPKYTGTPAIDSRLAVLFEFFAQGVTNVRGPEYDIQALIAVGYLAAQFGGAWCLIALEGLRKRNKGTSLAWTGSFGIVFQVVTITIIAPIYLVLHLLRAAEVETFDTVVVDIVDLKLLPVTTTLAYIVPTVGLAMPLLNILSPPAKYLAIVLWQPFPLYQTTIHAVLRWVSLGSPPSTQPSKPAYRAQLNRTYAFVLFLGAGAHLATLGYLAVSNLAGNSTATALSLTEILAPQSLSSPPTLALFHPPVSAISARSIVVSFLRWDVYCACAALSFWAAHLAGRSPSHPSRTKIILQVMIATILGGPVASSVILLWQRDLAFLETMPTSFDQKKIK